MIEIELYPYYNFILKTILKQLTFRDLHEGVNHIRNDILLNQCVNSVSTASDSAKTESARLPKITLILYIDIAIEKQFLNAFKKY